MIGSTAGIIDLSPVSKSRNPVLTVWKSSKGMIPFATKSAGVAGRTSRQSCMTVSSFGAGVAVSVGSGRFVGVADD